jgi:hypothetical protein
MNVEIETEAAQFPEKEHINGIFVAVHVKCQVADGHTVLFPQERRGKGKDGDRVLHPSPPPPPHANKPCR